MAEIPEWDTFVPVAYRKPEMEKQPVEKKGGGRNRSKKNTGQKQASNSQPTKSTANPFEAVLKQEASEPIDDLGDLTEEERKQYLEMLQLEQENQSVVPEPDSKKKEKWVPLFTAHGKDLEILLPGRYACQCMCTKHDLVHNCTNCGRIVCTQEGSGPCLTCGELVCTPEEMAVLRSGGIEAEKLRRHILDQNQLTLDFDKMMPGKENTNASQLAKAEQHKNTLLTYDRTAAQRTKIIDDQADYFNENVFHTPEQRMALRKKEEEFRKERFASRRERGMKFDLDIAGREFRQKGDKLDEMYAEPIENFSAESSSGKGLFEKLDRAEDFVDSPENWSLEAELSLIPAIELPENAAVQNFRIQDPELQEMRDPGMALSVMQPWASFIVMGLKPHEGRTWYTSHRGKLWIVSGNRVLSASEVIEEENAVKALTGNDLIVFPPQYETGFLLGCIDLVDCITQEEYQKRFPGGLLNTPYIFLFENPRQLQHTFPVQSKDKLFKLEYRLHEVAKRQGWKRPDFVWPPESTYGPGDR